MTGSGGQDELGWRRRSLAADPDGEASAGLVSRMRHGELAAERVRAAAALGHPAAHELFPDEDRIDVDEGMARLTAVDQWSPGERLGFELECVREALGLVRRKLHHPLQDALEAFLNECSGLAVAFPVELSSELDRLSGEAERRSLEAVSATIYQPAGMLPELAGTTTSFWFMIRQAIANARRLPDPGASAPLEAGEVEVVTTVAEQAAGIASLAIVEGALTGPGRTTSEALDEARRGERARQAERLAARLLSPVVAAGSAPESVFDQPKDERARRRRRRTRGGSRAADNKEP